MPKMEWIGIRPDSVEVQFDATTGHKQVTLNEDEDADLIALADELWNAVKKKINVKDR